MAKPAGPEVAEELYAAFEPAFTVLDSDATDWPTWRFCIAMVAGDLTTIHDIVTETETGVGWEVLLNPSTAPIALLPYLANFVGAHLRPDMTDAQKREAIEDPVAFGRGTKAFMEAVAQRHLTGTKTVTITERYTGKAWRLQVSTIAGETPEPERTEREIIEEAKPIGILLFFNAAPAWTWLEVREEPSYDTWLEVRTAFKTWLEFRTHEP